MKKISIIIPTYNEEKYLKPTLKNIINQTIKRKNYEIIICDNQSKDNTVKIAKKYADKVVVLKKRSSISRARNQGAMKANTPNLLFLDADTLINKDFIEKTLITLNNSKVGLPNKVIIGDGSLRLINFINSFYSKMTKGINITLGCCMAFRKKEFFKLKGFDEKLICSEDIDVLKKFNNKFELINSNVVHNDRRFRNQGYIKTLIYFLKNYIQYNLLKHNLIQYNAIR